MQKLSILFIVILILAGCQKNFISIVQEHIDENYLASSALNTPDPRKQTPPLGEKLIIEWKVPKQYWMRKPSLYLHVIYKDSTEAYFTYPMPYKMDYVVYSLLGEEYKHKKGILTYSAQIKVLEEEPYLDWKHQLWTKLIVLKEDQIEEQSEEDSFSSIDKSNSSVSDQPIQGSVKEREE